MGVEQIYTTEIFRIPKVVRKIPKPVNDSADFLGKNIEGQFYAEELSRVIIINNIFYQIDKILRKRDRNGSVEVSSSGVGIHQSLIAGFLLNQ
jgi:hypothetical protein